MSTLAASSPSSQPRCPALHNVSRMLAIANNQDANIKGPNIMVGSPKSQVIAR